MFILLLEIIYLQTDPYIKIIVKKIGWIIV